MKHKHMLIKNKRNSVEIIRDINLLLEELTGSENSASIKDAREKHNPKKQDNVDYSGPSGGIKLLIIDGYFKDSKSLPEVIERLHQEGYKYPLAPIAVALLRFVKKRVLVRLPSKNQNNRKVWVYVERK